MFIHFKLKFNFSLKIERILYTFLWGFRMVHSTTIFERYAQEKGYNLQELDPKSYEDLKQTLQEECRHVWEPAGSKRNRDRIHNKGNGKGNYKAYVCSECGKFKRRYLK